MTDPPTHATDRATDPLQAPSEGGPAPRPYDVFISYAQKDGKEVAARLEEGLARRGLRMWRDEARLLVGDKMPDELGRGLSSSSHAVVVVSPEYAERRWTMIELGGMVCGKFRGRIMPILYKTSRDDVASKLPMLADRLSETWDDDSAECLMDKIVLAARGGRGPKKPAAQQGGGATDADLVAGASKGAVASIPREIGGSTMSRAGQLDAIEGLLKSGGRVAVVGGKGSGKSVVACLLYERLAPSGAALLVRCDDFLGAESAEELDASVVPGRSLACLASAAARAQPGEGGMTVIFDSLDAAGRNERTMRAFRRLLEMVWGAGARTVVTVRSYDYEHSGIIGATDWGARHDLEELSDGEVGGVLKKLGSPAVPPGLKALLRNPLNLKILSLILARSPGADLASIGSEIDLYDAHWHHYVELEPLGARVKNMLYDAAEGMTGARKTVIPYAPGDEEAAARAQSSGILARTRDGRGIRYFHHAYMDYAMSRALFERHQPIQDYLRADDRNVFLRPTLALALAMAHRGSPSEFASIVEGIARADIRHHWKIAALTSLASVVPGEGSAAYASLKLLLTDQTLLQKHFLIGLARRRNASWLRAWGDTFVAWASDRRNPNGLPIIDYLKAAATAADGLCHGPAFAVATALAENSMDWQVRRNAAAALADIDADGKAEWLVAMSGSGDPHVRAGVALNLPRLVESGSVVAPEIFCSVYAYEESSTEETDMQLYGSLYMTSTKARDNDMNRHELGRMFPQLMESNPTAMMRALVLAAERMNRGILSKPGSGFVDDSSHWSKYMKFHDGGSSPLVCARRYMDRCTDEDFSRLVPLLEGTRLALLRAILIDCMAGRMPAFLGKLVDLLSDPRMHEARCLDQIVRRAFGGICGLADGEQRRRILGAMGDPGAPRGGSEADSKARGSGAPPPARMRPACVLSEPRAGLAAPALAPSIRTTSEDAEVPDPAAFIEGMLCRDLDRGEKISLLEAVQGALDDRPGVLGENLARRVAAFLVEIRRDPDPEGGDAAGGGAAEPGGAPAGASSVRGLAAKCLIRIAALREDEAVLGAVRELSEDPAGAVRSDVAGSLIHLLPAHYGLAHSIAMSYSRDPDARVVSHLPAALRHIARKEPASASAMVGNILETASCPPGSVVPLLLWLGLGLEDRRAAGLLRRIADEGAFAKEVRKGMPSILREEYLASTDCRGAALALLYGLLGDPDRDVRYSAAFFTLIGFGDNPAIDDREYIREIAPHLARISSILEEEPLDVGIADALTWFLKGFWSAVPETALECLEKVARIHGVAAASEPTIADSSLAVLAGLLQHHSLYDGEWDRCIDVLDTYAAAGWPEAMDLLAGMGERD